MREYRLPQSASHEFPPQIAEVAFFTTLPSRILGELLRFCTILECDAGDYVIRQGDEDRSLMFLLNGELQIEKDGELLAGAWKKGELLGELSHLRGTARSASLVAQCSVQCLKVSPEFLDHLPEVDQHAYKAALFRHLARVLADRLEMSSRRIVYLEKKLAEAPVTV